jgi:hypothetical protein
MCPDCGARQPTRRKKRRQGPRLDGKSHDDEGAFVLGSYGRPHHGAGILVLGLFSLFGLIWTLACPLPVSLGLGLAAWLWANAELRKMRAGLTDPRGHGLVLAGKVCGMIATVLQLIWVVFFLTLLIANSVAGFARR